VGHLWDRDLTMDVIAITCSSQSWQITIITVIDSDPQPI